MLVFDNKKIVFDYSHCQQCGACEAVCPKGAITLVMRDDATHDVVVDDGKCIRCQRCVRVCPANREEDYKDYFDGFGGKRYLLGYNTDDKIRRESSSGGVCKTIVIESLKNGLADGAYTLRRTVEFPFAEGVFYTKDNVPDFDDIPNSVYHSVMTCQNINKLKHCMRLIVVGTSCQLRAMNAALKGKADEIIRVCIFCKQQKTLSSTRFLAKMIGTNVPGNRKIFVRYRGLGWPGIVRVNEAKLPWNRAASLPFGRRLWTVPGCNVCGDPFGTNAGADISLMDPWTIRQPNDLGETLITVHTGRGMELLQIAAIRLEPKKFEEVKPALDLPDIWRKQQLVPFFRGEECNAIVRKAGKAEVRQRKFLRSLVETLPRMPLLFYRVLCHFWPDLRNRILKDSGSVSLD